MTLKTRLFLLKFQILILRKIFPGAFQHREFLRIVVLQPTVAFCAVCGELHIHSKESAYLLSRVLIHLGGDYTVTVRGEP